MKEAEEILDFVRAIPCGEFLTYGDISREVYGHGKAGPAVGQAIKAHECDDDLPWWRVVGSDGRILRDGQERRLRSEGVRFNANGTVPM